MYPTGERKEKIMSANKFKVGDKVRVRKGLVTDEYGSGGVLCSPSMVSMGGEVLTINYVMRNYYLVDECEFCWSDEMLEPVEKTLDNLCVNDFVRSSNGTRKVLAVLENCCLLSCLNAYDLADSWYTIEELKVDGFYFFDPQVKVIEINGKKYDEADIERAIKDLEPIE